MIRRSLPGSDSAPTPTGAAPPTTTGSIWCCETELSTGVIQSVTARTPEHRAARVLTRLHGEPLGYLSAALPADGLQPEALLEAALVMFREPIAAHLRGEGLADAPTEAYLPAAAASCPNRPIDGALVSVVICTRDRTTLLARCLKRIQQLAYPQLEVIVVDNSPSDAQTAQLVAALSLDDPRIRYVCEPRPGLARARNRGLAEAKGAYLAYTDDDVSVDAGWIDGIVRGFGRRPDVGCVTGLVCTAGIDNAAEAYFDARNASWSTRCESIIFDLGTSGESKLYPYAAGSFGTGANVAFDRELLHELGGFDEALGAGTKTRGGEDLDIFVRVLQENRAIAYEPAAVTWHHHRTDPAALVSQMFGYGSGLSAFVTKLILQGSTRMDVLRKLPRGAFRVAEIASDTERRLDRTKPPAGAVRREFMGLVAGPFLYARSRRSASRSR